MRYVGRSKSAAVVLGLVAGQSWTAMSFRAGGSAVASAASRPARTSALAVAAGESRVPGSDSNRRGVATKCSATAAATVLVEGQRELYGKLCKKLKEVERLAGIQGLLSWDEQVMMPAGGAASRANQKTALAAVIHEKKVDTGLGDLLRQLQEEQKGEAASELSVHEAAVVRDAVRDYNHETRKSAELAAREADIEARAYAAWVAARKDGDWEAFAPSMEEMVGVKRDVAEATRSELGGAYEGCLDQFERGMSTERLREVFGELKAGLVPLLKAIQEKVAEEDKSGAAAERHPAPLHSGEQWGKDEQAALCRDMAEKLGFDMSKGRLDVSVHPFTGGPGPSDVRITTRFSNNWMEGVAGTVHEVGHALYEQGRPGGDMEDLPVSRALSMGVHESQSLLWERMVFQSRPFWKFAAPLVRARFPHTEGVSDEAFYRGLNRVAPSLIRVDADEVTYPLHIILRFEIEQGLMDGSIAVKDVPSVWASKMKELLGVDVPGDAEGCLQDIHWSVGAFGYFPSYTLGAVMACQFLEAARLALPDLDSSLEAGNFEPLKTWLNREVHARGSLYASPDELLSEVTGDSMRPTALVEHLKSKYTEIYDL
ncbi:unnamed protein product [Ectocarpus sp. 4 AP-2014]